MFACRPIHVLTELRTTGVPKGVEISHYNIISNSLQVIFKRNKVADTPRALERKGRISLTGERWLAPLPMFRAYVRIVAADLNGKTLE